MEEWVMVFRWMVFLRMGGMEGLEGLGRME